MRAALLTLCLIVLGAPAAARAGTDLRDVPPIGIAASDTAALAAAGDVNGDGAADVAVGLEGDRRMRESQSLGDIAVVGFNGADVTRPGFSGLVLSHLNEPMPESGQLLGGAAAGVGDWDGDGLADVAFGAIGAAPHGRADAGSVFVVLGRREPGAIDVRSGPGIVRIDGPARRSMAGSVLAAAGDVDGDGRPDLVIGLPGERAVVVRGGAPAGTTIDLANPPAGAVIELRGLDGGDPLSGEGTIYEAAAFAAAGDVDGDGRGELLAGIPSANSLRGTGKALVLRGAPAGGVVDARQPGTVLASARGDAWFGGSVATLPDADGDGRPEWIVGEAQPDGVITSGELSRSVFVIFSRARGTIRPGRAGQPVVTIDARGRGGHAGAGVAGVPDMTGDGVPDVLVGLPDASPSCRAKAGAVALVPGRRSPGVVRIGTRTPRVDGPYPGAGIGSSIAVAGTTLFLGGLPFQNAAWLDLWRVPVDTAASPALPAAGDCISVKIAKRSRAQLLRERVLHVTLRSDAGDGRAHRVRLRFVVQAGDAANVEGSDRTVELRRAGTRRVTLSLPRRAARLLDGRGHTAVYVLAEQLVGSGTRASRAAFDSDALTFG